MDNMQIIFLILKLCVVVGFISGLITYVGMKIVEYTA